ncbi:MAG: PDZ domain-containing protein [Planctomycetia bacterium]
MPVWKTGSVAAAWCGRLIVGTLLAAATSLGEEAALQPTPAEIATWIAQLGAPQYAQREAAARSLAAAGRPAVGPLQQAIMGTDFEVASRSVEILRGMLVADDPQLAGDAERRLEAVAAGGSAVARVAESALEFHQAGLAAAARERLAGQGAVFRERLVAVGEHGVEVEFNAAWRGGPEDWRLLPRLRGVVCVSVHGVPLDEAAVGALGRVRGVRRIDLFGTGASEKAIAALVAGLPDTLVDVRKGGKLGVSSIVQAGPCELSGVQPGSAADKAGLRQGDVIVAADGEPVASFEALTARVSRHGPGEVVRLEVRREGGGEGERFECEVRLDAW